MMPQHWTDLPEFTDARTARTCARLGLRTARRRLRAGRSAAGIAALYDAVLFGMQYYIARHKRCRAWVAGTDPWDAQSLFHALARAGVFEDPLTFNRFSLMVERALWQQSYSFDADSTFAEVETILTKLEVLRVEDASPSKRSERRAGNVL